MAFADLFLKGSEGWGPVDRLQRQLKDYVNVSDNLIWQRQGIFMATLALAGFYFDPMISIYCYVAIMVTEVMDMILSGRVKAWNDQDPRKGRLFLGWVMFNTLASAVVLSVSVILIALQQESGGHFTPLFFLFAASLFAAVNNHQVLPALFLRLTIYGATFLFIATWKIWLELPPISSPIWLQFFTVAFVMYFIVDCSFVFLKLYRRGLTQIEELTVEHQKTKAALAAKSQFLSTVSHELRTPLTSIKGTLDLVNNGVAGPVPDQMKHLLAVAGRNSEWLSTLINDLLDLQMIDAGQMRFELAPLRVADLVRDAVTLGQPFARHTGVSIVAAPVPDDLLIAGDADRLAQVMSNLLSNAAKFSHRGGVVQISAERRGGKIQINVKDDGIGIPENSKDRVFGRFSQVDSSDKRRIGGTGLGMNITKTIVECHGGDIDYISTLGQGATFHIAFDAMPATPKTAQKTAPTALPDDTATGTPKPVRDIKRKLSA